MLLKSGWFDWLPWRKKEAEPEPLFDGASWLESNAVLTLVLILSLLAAAIAIYRDPRVFWHGMASMLGEMVGAIIAFVVVAAAVAGAAIVIFDVNAIAVVVVLVIAGAIMLFALSGG